MTLRFPLAAVLCAAVTLPLAAGAAPTPAAGGANARSSVEGCMGAQLFNGVWRLKVLSVDPAAQYNDGALTTGVGVKVQLRNGTSQTIAADDTGLSDINGKGIDLAFADENVTNAVGSGTGLTTQFTDKKLPPGGPTTVTIYFPYGADKTSKPAKLLVAVDPKLNRVKVAYTTKSPSFRVHLDCTAS